MTAKYCIRYSVPDRGKRTTAAWHRGAWSIQYRKSPRPPASPLAFLLFFDAVSTQTNLSYCFPLGQSLRVLHFATPFRIGSTILSLTNQTSRIGTLQCRCLSLQDIHSRVTDCSAGIKKRDQFEKYRSTIGPIQRNALGQQRYTVVLLMQVIETSLICRRVYADITWQASPPEHMLIATSYLDQILFNSTHITI